MQNNLQRINSKRDGRYLVKAPEGYPGTKYDGKYTYEHRAVWWLEKGYLPPPGYHIHHINGNPQDNRIENLEAISASEHARDRHHGGKEAAEISYLECAECKIMFPQLFRTVRFRKISGQTKFYCCKSCQISYSNRTRTGIKLNYPKNRKSFTPMKPMVCRACSSCFEIPERVYRTRIKAGVSSFHCSRSCINKNKSNRLAVIK